MKREVVATGRDVSAAIDNGCTELGISREDAEFEIISLPKKTFLGLKFIPAKVRVYQELPDIKPAAPKPAPRPAVAPPPKPAQPKAAVPQPAATKPAPPKPVTTTAPKAPLPGSTPPRPGAAPAVHRPEPRPAAPAELVEQDEPTLPQVEIEPTPELRGKVEKAAQYLCEVMRAMGFDEVAVTPAYYSDSVCLRLSGATMGMVIGRRGETLDALQYLTSLVANRGDGDYIRVNIDSGNYREKREKTLTALARKLALQAVRTGKSTTLEPMNPYERRVIHGAVSQIRGATSTSVGADPNRRVVISCADPGKVRPSGGNRPTRSDRPVHQNRPEGTRPVGAPMGAETLPSGIVGSEDSTETASVVESPVQERNEQVVYPFRSAADRPERPERRDRDRSRGGRDRRDGDRAPRAPRPSYAPAPAADGEPAQPKVKLNDSELFGDLPMGVPLVAGEKPATPRVVAPKPEPKKSTSDDTEGGPRLYGKI
ncbi:MAG: RNA-binding cell elongation regulator Jag/EloR [Angelakisella sp.]